MSIFWNIVSNSDDGSSSANIVFPDGTTMEARDNHPNYKEVVNYLIGLNGDYDVDEAQADLDDLVNIVSNISERLTKVSDRVTTDGTNIYFDHDPVDSSVAEYLLKALQRDGFKVAVEVEEEELDELPDVTWRGIVAFMEKLYQNPSAESIDHLYSFIRRYDLTIRENGDFIAFKGVDNEFRSFHAGPGIVNGKKFPKSHLENKPGNVVEIARSYVNTSREHGCSTGLHCGSFAYAKSFSRGQKLVSVAVNPRDVVSVPEDCEFQKVRVSRYEVLSEMANDFTEDDIDYFWDEDGDTFECRICGDEMSTEFEAWDEICEECYVESEDDEFGDEDDNFNCVNCDGEFSSEDKYSGSYGNPICEECYNESERPYDNVDDGLSYSDIYPEPEEEEVTEDYNDTVAEKIDEENFETTSDDSDSDNDDEDSGDGYRFI